MNHSLNDLELNNQLLASLYTHVLVGNIEAKPIKPGVNRVTTDATPVENEPKPAQVLRFLGNNDKHVTILVHYPDDAYLPEDALAFLTKILLACQMNIADIAIINAAKQPSWSTLLSNITPEKVIAFGTAVPNRQIDLFSIENTNNILWLSAPPLSDFITDSDQAKQYKQKLWSCLKQLFQIK